MRFPNVIETIISEIQGLQNHYYLQTYSWNGKHPDNSEIFKVYLGLNRAGYFWR
jgi:hypothetical protein